MSYPTSPYGEATLGPMPPIVSTSIKTLRQLAIDGRYISRPLYLPHYILDHDWEIKLDGGKVTQWVSEAYAPHPGATGGWVVMYDKPKEGEFFTGSQTTKYGNVEITDLGRIKHDEEIDNE